MESDEVQKAISCVDEVRFELGGKLGRCNKSSFDFRLLFFFFFFFFFEKAGSFNFCARVK